MSPIRFGEQFAQDIRYAFRTMAARPLFTVMAVLSLALGIGANTAIYSFMDSILMRAIPVRDPASLVVLNWHAATHPKVIHSFSGSSYDDPKFGQTSGNFPYAAFELLTRRDSGIQSSLCVLERRASQRPDSRAGRARRWPVCFRRHSSRDLARLRPPAV